MSIGVRLATGLGLVLAVAGSLAFAQQGVSVTLEMPEGETWAVLDDTVAGDTYNREWIPGGTTYESADWLIAQQKIRVDDKISANKFLEQIYEISAEACTTVSHDEPERVRVNGHRGVIGRTMCARRLGEEFGTFSDRLIVIENGYAYIVTSELRFPPMIVAGVLSFDRDKDPTAAVEFMDREERSRRFVRERIRIE